MPHFPQTYLLSHKEDLEAAVQLVHKAGLATGHADTCVELMRKVLEQYELVRGQRDEARGQAVMLHRRVELIMCVADDAAQLIEKLKAQLDYLTRKRDCVTEPPPAGHVVICTDADALPGKPYWKVDINPTEGKWYPGPWSNALEPVENDDD